MSRSTGRRIGSRNRDSVELRVTCCGQRLALIGLPLTPPDAPVWFDPEPRGQLVEHDNDDATTLNVVCACGSDTLISWDLAGNILRNWRTAYLAGTVARVGDFDVKRAGRRTT